MFDFLLGRRDLSREWKRAADLTLTFDLGKAQLNALQMDDPIDAASFLGPADDKRAAKQGAYCYHDLGLCVASENRSTISWIELVFNDEDHEYQPFSGRVTFRGAEVSLARMKERDFLHHFGECYWRDQDEDETILFYEFPQWEWQVEFDERGILKRLPVTTRAIMADKEQRAAYGVTRPWPPQ